jgi:UDP-N-acetylmuramoylalanine--D-glutamate ligase
MNKKVTILILFGENKFELAKFFNKSKQIIAIDLFDAVEKGLKNCSHGHTLLFSPGTSSFDQFNSYSERGDKFKEYVQKLS